MQELGAMCGMGGTIEASGVVNRCIMMNGMHKTEWCMGYSAQHRRHCATMEQGMVCDMHGALWGMRKMNAHAIGTGAEWVQSHALVMCT